MVKWIRLITFNSIQKGSLVNCHLCCSIFWEIVLDLCSCLIFVWRNSTMPKSPTPENHHLSSYPNPGYLLYIGVCIIHTFVGDSKKPFDRDPIMKQSGFHGKELRTKPKPSLFPSQDQNVPRAAPRRRISKIKRIYAMNIFYSQKNWVVGWFPWIWVSDDFFGFVL